MENIILELIKVDDEAKNILKKSEIEKENFKISLKQKSNEIIKEIEDRKLLQLKEFEIECESSAKNRLIEIESTSKTKTEDMVNFFNENKTSWINDIFENIIRW